MKARFAQFSLIAAAIVIAGSLEAAQGAGQAAPGGGGQTSQNPPPPPKNLQVLPKDISREDLTATMRGFTRALGVQCNFCHIAEGRGGRNDFAADEKETKKKARVMLNMVAHVNEMLATELGKPPSELVKVECATCHRGAQIPKVDLPAPAATEAPRPPAS